MATIRIPRQITPTKIDRFLGLNENVDGEYGLKLGEAVTQVGWRVTSGGQLKRMEGYKHFITGLTGNVQGMWQGKLNGIEYFLFVNHGHLYSYDMTATPSTTVLADLITAEVVTDLGTLTDAPTRFIPFGSKVYLLNGHEYKSFNGVVATPSTDSLVTVTGYRPLIAISTPPAGGGTLYEEINMLTGMKHQTFSGDGAAKDYQLAETDIDSVDYVYVAGVLKTVTTDYTVDLANGKVTFVSAPATGVPNNVDIGWTKDNGTRATIEACRFAIDYSGQTDNRLFLWGSTTNKNRMFWTGLANGIPSAEYFEANAYSDVGSGQYAITDIVRQYSNINIFLENEAHYAYYDTLTIGEVTTANFPTFPLNDSVGNVAFGQAQLINNDPITLYKGVRQWGLASTTRSEINEVLISQRVQNSLDTVDLTSAVTVDWQEMKELWINIGSTVWIYNYFNNTWYKRNNVAATCFIVIDGELYYGKSGSIEKFDTNERNDNGTAIETTWEMGFYDFECEHLKKYMNKFWVALKPSIKSRATVSVITNNDSGSVPQDIYYNMATFILCDFDNFSFITQSNPQPFRIRMKEKGFAYMKVRLTSDSLVDVATILSIVIQFQTGGKV